MSVQRRGREVRQLLEGLKTALEDRDAPDALIEDVEHLSEEVAWILDDPRINEEEVSEA